MIQREIPVKQPKRYWETCDKVVKKAYVTGRGSEIAASKCDMIVYLNRSLDPNFLVGHCPKCGVSKQIKRKVYH